MTQAARTAPPSVLTLVLVLAALLGRAGCAAAAAGSEPASPGWGGAGRIECSEVHRISTHNPSPNLAFYSGLGASKLGAWHAETKPWILPSLLGGSPLGLWGDPQRIFAHRVQTQLILQCDVHGTQASGAISEQTGTFRAWGWAAPCSVTQKCRLVPQWCTDVLRVT